MWQLNMPWKASVAIDNMSAPNYVEQIVIIQQFPKVPYDQLADEVWR